MLHPEAEHDLNISVFEAGFECALEGDPVEDCPYEESDPHHRWWVEGWGEGRSVFEELSDA